MGCIRCHAATEGRGITDAQVQCTRRLTPRTGKGRPPNHPSALINDVHVMKDEYGIKKRRKG